ncbi:MAG: hypothetical protein GYA87_05925 [Christensenellaceae bacterium]|nr:hypothetical protein [Christensenellaceae bacterium]
MKHLKFVFIFLIGFLFILSANQQFIAEEWVEESVLEEFVSKTLIEMKEDKSLEKYPWAKYSLNEGIDDFNIIKVSKSGKNQQIDVSFKIKSFTADISNLRKLKKYPYGFWKDALKSVEEYDFEIKTSLIIKADDKGISFKSKNAYDVYKKVLQATNSAKNNYKNRNAVNALKEITIPSPTAVNIKRIQYFNEDYYSDNYIEYLDKNNFENPSLVSSALLGIKANKFNFDQGPENVVLEITTTNYDAALESAIEKTKDELLYMGSTQNLSDEELTEILIKNLSNSVIYQRLKTGAKNISTININMFKLMGEDASWKAEFEKVLIKPLTEKINKYITELKAYTLTLPSYPRHDNPPTGSYNGKRPIYTECNFIKAKNDKANYAIIMFDSSGSIMDRGFIRANNSKCTLYVPEGEYTLITAYGDTWYGNKYLFGDEGKYIKTEAISILGKPHRYTFELNAQDANVLAYEVPLSVIAK